MAYLRLSLIASAFVALLMVTGCAVTTEYRHEYGYVYPDNTYYYPGYNYYYVYPTYRYKTYYWGTYPRYYYYPYGRRFFMHRNHW